MYRCDQRLFQ